MKPTVFFHRPISLAFLTLFGTSVGASIQPPSWVSPERNGVNVHPYPSFLWNEAKTPTAARDLSSSYQIQIAPDEAFRNLLADDRVPIPRYVPHVPLHGRIHARVREFRGTEAGPWSVVVVSAVAPPERTVLIPPDADWKTAQQRIAEALKGGPGLKVLLSPHSVYRWDPDGAAFTFNMATNLILDGQGSTLILKKHNACLANMSQCAGIMFTRLTVDWEEWPHIAARVDAIESDTLLTTPLPGYPGLDAPYLRDALAFSVLLDPVIPGRLKTGAPFILNLDLSKAERIGAQVRVGLKDAGQRSYYQAGDRVVAFARAKGRSLVNGNLCSNVAMVDIETHGTSAGHYLMLDGTDFKVLGCRELIPPGRVFGGNADGVHTRANVIGPWIEGCTIEGLGDDGVAIYSKAVYIESAPAPDTLVLGAPFFNLQVGDALTVWNPRQGEVRATDAKVKSLAPLSPSNYRVILESPLGFNPETRFAGISNDQVFNASRNNAMFMVRSNVIRSIRRYGTVIRGVNGVVEGNLYEGCSSAAVMVRNEPAYWRNGLFSTGLIIRSNRIHDTGFDTSAAEDGSIDIRLEHLGGANVRSVVQSRMVLEGNGITGWRGAAVRLESADRIQVLGNTVGPRAKDGSEEIKRIPVKVQDSTAITFQGNLFKDKEPWDRLFEVAHSDITTNGNLVQVDFRKPDPRILLLPGGEGTTETGPWNKSGVPGALGSATRYTSAMDASLHYRVPKGKYGLSIFVVRRSGNDPAVEVSIKSGSAVDKRDLDTSVGESGWLDLGTFDFGGDESQGVTIRKVQPEGFLRTSALRITPVP